MQNYVTVENLEVSEVLFNFVNEEALPNTGLDKEKFWRDFSQLIDELTPENKQLLVKREQLQKKINKWHQQHKDAFNFNTYKTFLTDIGYLEPKVEDFSITTKNVDKEVSVQAGPQLVVPVNNARYALNAANARWGSLYDAIYGTDVIPNEKDFKIEKEYNPLRGQEVIRFAKDFLDKTVPLLKGSHAEVKGYKIVKGDLVITLNNDQITTLHNSLQFKGYRGLQTEPMAILLENHGLHFEIQIDREHPIGKDDFAGVKDIYLESALSTIMDCEDSVTAVDAEDKVEVYRNLLGLMKGDLSVTFKKAGKTVTRRLKPDRLYRSPNGERLSLRGRSLIFIRNVGHLMTNNAILNRDQQEVPEGIMDGVLTGLLAMHNLNGDEAFKNSLHDSIYIVKPKMHGSKEVAFANKLFNHVEDLLGLKRFTLKIGVMDEERRTSLNLQACIKEVKERIAFINTGFLDRTGDEIHTSMEAGVMIRKNEMKSTNWLNSYESSNVAVGIQCGLPGHAQIGKGMWAMPDLMANMLEQKITHPKSGANTAWVPSPTAATLHALHYHEIDVNEVQAGISSKEDFQDAILEIPLVAKANWSAEEIQQELNNNAQGILGYMVRWIDQGIGCSKVPDINNIGLMEDRATLRISSQHIANWLFHGICTEEQVIDTMKRMAKVVDYQNNTDPLYRPMSPNFEESIAFEAACTLVLEGTNQPNGYTEPILHKSRIKAKEKYKTVLSK